MKLLDEEKITTQILKLFNSKHLNFVIKITFNMYFILIIIINKF